MTPEELRKVRSEAGKTKNSNKGFGSMDEQRHKEISRLAGIKSAATRKAKKDESNKTGQVE